MRMSLQKRLKFNGGNLDQGEELSRPVSTTGNTPHLCKMATLNRNNKVYNYL